MALVIPDLGIDLMFDGAPAANERLTVVWVVEGNRPDWKC